MFFYNLKIILLTYFYKIKFVNKINSLESTLHLISNQELKNKFFNLYGSHKKLSNQNFIALLAIVKEAAKRTLKLRHNDQQILSSIFLYNNYITEVKTGEGKTLISTLIIILNVINKKGAHVATVNEYLAKRDYEELKPLYEFLSLSVSYIDSKSSPKIKYKAYRNDITYSTYAQFGFDFLYDSLNSLVKIQRELNFVLIDEIDNILIDIAETPLVISEENNLNCNIYNYLIDFLKTLNENDLIINKKKQQIELSSKGILKTENFLIKNNLLMGSNLYDFKNTILLHYINQSLVALYLLTKNIDYVVNNNNVILLDKHTGRLMDGHSFSNTLHHALEAKENLTLKVETKPAASITIQNFFKFYDKFVGMTGTGYSENIELNTIYNLNVAKIKEKNPNIRYNFTDIFTKTNTEKFEKTVKLIKKITKKKQPILLGTSDIKNSLFFEKLLKNLNLNFEVLNAFNEKEEKKILNKAGTLGNITIATNIAGRGANIKLGSNQNIKKQKKNNALIKMLGGLYVIALERNPNKRIDDQLSGRAGRNGEPGKTQHFVSLEDDIFYNFKNNQKKWLNYLLNNFNKNFLINQIEKLQLKNQALFYQKRQNFNVFNNIMNEERQIFYEKIIKFKNLSHNELLKFIHYFFYKGSKLIILDFIKTKNIYIFTDNLLKIFNINLPIKELLKNKKISIYILYKYLFISLKFKLKLQLKNLNKLKFYFIYNSIISYQLLLIYKKYLLKIDDLKLDISINKHSNFTLKNKYKIKLSKIFNKLWNKMCINFLIKFNFVNLIKK